MKATQDHSNWFQGNPKFTPKPCPFCPQKTHIKAERVVIETDNGPEKLAYWLTCVACHCTGPLAASQEEAERQWGCYVDPDESKNLRYAVFGGNQYYAGGGINDFFKEFDSMEEATQVASHQFSADFEWWQVVDLATFEIVTHSVTEPYSS